MTGEYIKPILEEFGNRLTYKIFKVVNNKYFVIARPLLPHETIQSISPYPYQDKEIQLSFDCVD